MSRKKVNVKLERFDALMIELTVCMSEERKFRKVRPNNKLGEKRYKEDAIGLSDDLKAIAVYQNKPSKLSFGEKVADFYGCFHKVLHHNNCPVGGEYELRIYF